MSLVTSYLQGVGKMAFKNIVKTLPLPVSLPTELRRLRSRISQAELANQIVLMNSLRDSLDQHIAQRFLDRGSEIRILDRERAEDCFNALQKPQDSGGRIHFAPIIWNSADDYARELKSAVTPSHPSQKSVTFIMRVRRPKSAEASAVLQELEQLYAMGRACAQQLPKRSRIVFVIDWNLHNSPSGQVLAASLTGFARSLAKEFGKRGSTVHVLECVNQDSAEDCARVLAFLASPRASFLTSVHWRSESFAKRPEPAEGSLHGRVALITGAARGIGASIAECFAREGATVGINDLPSSEKEASKTLAKLRKMGARVAFFPFDVATVEGARAMSLAVEKEFGRLDILINNAGITRDRTIKRMTPSQWQQAVNVNLGSQIYVTEALIPLFAEQGAIVNLSSVMGLAGNFGQTNYCAAKAGVLGWTKHLQQLLADKQITVNAMAPGFIETRLTRAMPFVNREMAKQLTALLQPGLPVDVAELARFLVSADGQSINGQVVRVDGGMAIGA